MVFLVRGLGSARILTDRRTRARASRACWCSRAWLRPFCRPTRSSASGATTCATTVFLMILANAALVRSSPIDAFARGGRATLEAVAAAAAVGQRSRVPLRVRPERRSRPDRLGSVPERVASCLQHPWATPSSSVPTARWPSRSRWGWRSGPVGALVVALGRGRRWQRSRRHLLGDAGELGWRPGPASLSCWSSLRSRARVVPRYVVATRRGRWAWRPSSWPGLGLNSGRAMVALQELGGHHRRPGRPAELGSSRDLGHRARAWSRSSGHGSRPRRDGQGLPRLPHRRRSTGPKDPT